MADRASRRRFIKTGAAAGACLIANPAAIADNRNREPDGSNANDAASDYVPLYFTAREMRFLHAVCDRLIPSDDHGPGAVELGVPEFLDRQTSVIACRATLPGISSVR